MTSTRSRIHGARRRAHRPPVAPPAKKRFVAISGIVAFAFIVVFAIAPPPPPSAADVLVAQITGHAQSLTTSKQIADPAITRDGYSANPGPKTLAASGTNYDWAKLVMLSGGWPTSTGNITVMVRWMRQENGPPDWWNRNNPLNNGLGSGGGAGLGSYANLVIAAQKVAENLQRNPVFGAVRAGFASSAPTNVIEQAIWASPWASSHYANGAHWSYAPVPTVTAPGGAW
ncbi:MAG: hypothetical protein QOK46_1104 [Microbacteriaceae bacterium]|jgi:hypothetical protein|nr:hypothetical protein [Microbacteriaceae bacterium]MDQ1554026.1 hypothetical protein [Microbacteriaceae bacterium]